jgi:signal recognition particle subunit SRP54
LFDALTDRLTGVFDRLSGRGVLSEKDVEEVMREIRVALLEADVALPVVRDFIAKAKEAATGEAVIRSVRPADQVVKITYDGLVDMLGGTGEPESLNISLNPPTVILMAGLQGSGKTTTAGKLALKLVKDRKKVLLASLDTRRPAAMEQLGMLASPASRLPTSRVAPCRRQSCRASTS